jgi:hypothetical protein
MADGSRRRFTGAVVNLSQLRDDILAEDQLSDIKVVEFRSLDPVPGRLDSSPMAEIVIEFTSGTLSGSAVLALQAALTRARRRGRVEEHSDSESDKETDHDNGDPSPPSR